MSLNIPNKTTGSVAAPSAGRTKHFADTNGVWVTKDSSGTVHTYITEDALNTLLTSYQLLSEKNQANGYAGLDGSGKIDATLLPISVTGSIRVIGMWDASTNTPDLTALTLDQGEAYQVSVSGSTSINGETNWKAKDLVVWDDNLTGNWFKLDNTDDVISVFGRTGPVTAQNGDYNTSQVTESVNLYFTELRVANTPAVLANTSKVSADGSVTTHNDVTNAGSGQIITTPERTLLGNAIQPGDNISDLNNDAGYVVRPTFNVNLNNAEPSVSRNVSGGRTIFTITHNLNTLDVTAQVFRLADGRDINWRVERSSVNAIEVSRAGNIANNLYRVLIST